MYVCPMSCHWSPSFNLETWQVETMAWHKLLLHCSCFELSGPLIPNFVGLPCRLVHFLVERYAQGNGHLNREYYGTNHPFMIGFPNHFQTLPGASRSVWSVKLLPGGRTFAGKPIFGMRNGVCAWHMPNLYQFVNTMIKHAGSGVPNFERHV